MDNKKGILILLSIICIFLLFIVIDGIVLMFTVDTIIGVIGISISSFLSILMLYGMFKKPSKKTMNRIINRIQQDD